MPHTQQGFLLLATNPTRRCVQNVAQQQQCLLRGFHSDNLRAPQPRRQASSQRYLHPRTHQRNFSVSRCSPANMRIASQKAPAQPSSKLAQSKAEADAMQSSDFVHLIGLLPQTFIMPTGSDLPSWTKNLRARLALEYRNTRNNMVDYFRNMWVARYHFNTRVKLEAADKVAAEAAKLYGTIYALYASGTVDRLSGYIAPQYLDSLKRRIATRPPNRVLRWVEIGRVSPPKVVSRKLSPLPDSKTAGLSQAVVKMHTIQALVTLKIKKSRDRTGKLVTSEIPVDADGTELDGDWEELAKQKAKERIEYIVVNQPIKDCKPGEWMVWGMVQETTLEKYKHEERQYFDRMRTALEMQKGKKLSAD